MTKEDLVTDLRKRLTNLLNWEKEHPTADMNKWERLNHSIVSRGYGIMARMYEEELRRLEVPGY